MEKNIRWGILGTGWIAQKFVNALPFVENAELVAVASRSQATADDFGRTHQIKKCYGNYEDLVKDEEIDAVYVATPHNLHYENTLMCLEHHKAVLCEKPFAMNLSQGQEMIQKAQEKKVFLMEAFWTKFLPSFQKVQTLIQSGAIGEIKSIHADFGTNPPYHPEGRLFNKALGGGSLLDIGIYPLWLATTLLGKPDDIKAEAIFGETHVDEHCGMMLKYNTGKMAMLSSTIRAYTAIEANIYGDKARIRMSHLFFTPITKIDIITGIDESYEVTPVAFEYVGNGYNYEIQEVTNCLLEGKTESQVMTHQNSLFLMEMLDWVRAEAGIDY
jgi:predicted dehydrogenase